MTIMKTKLNTHTYNNSLHFQIASSKAMLVLFLYDCKLKPYLVKKNVGAKLYDGYSVCVCVCVCVCVHCKPTL